MQLRPRGQRRSLVSDPLGGFKLESRSRKRFWINLSVRLAILVAASITALSLAGHDSQLSQLRPLSSLTLPLRHDASGTRVASAVAAPGAAAAAAAAAAEATAAVEVEGRPLPPVVDGPPPQGPQVPGGMEHDWGRAEGWPCRASGYCSLGRSKPWKGDIATNEQLRDMLNAVAYKKEIIFTLSNMEGTQLELALNLIRSAEALGYGHALVVSPKEAGCHVIPESLKFSCVWDSRPIVETEEPFNSYQRRWEFMARVVRMGYNALSLDSDAMLAADIYTVLKQPPFADKNFIAQDDYGKGINCGVVYLQNGHPSGPTVWMAVEVAYRTERQREDPEFMRSVYPGWTNADTWEQNFWNFVLSSVASGKPWHIAPDKCPDWEKELAPYNYRTKLQRLDVQWPPEWRNRTGLESDRGPLVVLENLTLPLVGDPEGDAWWQKNSKFFYPPKAGEVSTRFMELIKSSNDQPFYELGKPWQAMELPKENFAQLPTWFTAPYSERGVAGYWETSPPAQIIPHDTFFGAPTKDWKVYTFKGSRMFHFDVLEAVHGNNVLGLAHPKLLMLAPGVQLFTDSEGSFAEAVRQLARLSAMMGRRLVVPNPPCDSSWIARSQNPPEIPWQPVWPYRVTTSQVMQFKDILRPGNHTYCHWLQLIQPECRNVSVPHADMVAFLVRWRNRQQAEPSAKNTLWFDEWQAAGGAAGAPGGPPTGTSKPFPEVEAATAEAVVEAAAAFADWPVLFLGAVPKLANSQSLAPLDDSFKTCRVF